MVYPEIKIKEKRKSFTLRLKVLKEDVEGVIFSSDELTELKKTIMDELNEAVDNMIVEMVENEELEDFQVTELEDALNRVGISQNESEVPPMEETEQDEEEVEETEEEQA